IGSFQSTAATSDLATNARIELPPAEPIAPANLPSWVVRIVGTIDERGRFPGATALAAGRPCASAGEKEKSVSWLFRKKPSTIRPVPKMDSTVVVIDTTLPAASRTMKCEVPVGSSVLSLAATGAPAGTPAAGGGPAAGPINRARRAT